jgi:hypothetical protein
MEFQKNPINGLVTDTRSQAGRQTWSPHKASLFLCNT